MFSKSKEYEPFSDIYNATEVAKDIFSMYARNRKDIIGVEGVKNMMRDTYNNVHKSFEPS